VELPSQPVFLFVKRYLVSPQRGKVRRFQSGRPATHDHHTSRFFRFGKLNFSFTTCERVEYALRALTFA
jgi:hypothetical protein